MEFRILGPLEVYDGAREIPLAAAKLRALLVVLLVNANRVVALDALIDALWDEQPPETARKALQVYVSQLRTLLEPRRRAAPERLVTRAPGYLLRVERDELDLERFERLAEEARSALAAGRPNEAAETFRHALTLWRGMPLADVAALPFASAEIARLEESHLSTLEDRIEADLARGRHADVIGELDRLVARNPLRERLHGQLMLALYRSRRQADALAAYQRARHVLVEELGIEPSRSLQELEKRILTQDPALDVAAPGGARAPSVEAPTGRRAAGVFVDREWELGELGAALDDSLAGRGRLVVLVGEAGIGKTRVADELASHAKTRGSRVLWGRSWGRAGAPPFWPWTQALRPCVAEMGDAASSSLRALALGELANAGEGFRLYDAVTTFLHELAVACPLVLVLDDLHLADAESIRLLEFVASHLAVMPVLVVATYREAAEAPADERIDSLAALDRYGARRIRLGRLPETAVARYVEAATGTAPTGDVLAAIERETRGNPLALAETVRRLAADGSLGRRASSAPR